MLLEKMSKNIKFLGLLLTLIIIFIILLKGLNVSKDYSNEKLKSKIDFSLNAKKLFSDEIINISDLFDKNSPSVVNIWASWCAPCREEHQFLMKLKDMNINIIGINYKDSPKNAKNFLSSLGNPYSEVITDNDGTKSIEFGAIGVPETFIISGKTNEIIKKYIGPLTSDNLIEIKNLLKKMLKILKLILLLYFSFNFSYANEINTKVDQITKNLRCLICQGQSVYDSQSDFAVSMKLVVKNKIDEGKEEEEIYDYLKNKYGEWIVYEPELNQNTFLLWSIPLILFAFGGLLIIRKVSIK